MAGTIAVSWGPYGGFYVHPRRLCLGWVALTYVGVELDDMMEAYAREVSSAAAAVEVDGSGYSRGGVRSTVMGAEFISKHVTDDPADSAR